MAKEVMNEEVKINEEATEVEVPVKESKIKKILAYAAGAVVVIGGIALTVVKIKGSGLDEVVEETTEE